MVQLDLKVTTSATKCTVHWGNCGRNKFKNHYVQLYVFSRIVKYSSTVTKALLNERIQFSALEYSWDTDSGSSYVVQLEVKDPNDDRVVAIGKHQLRACFSNADLEKLYKKAVHHCHQSEQNKGDYTRQLKLVGKLYRCKPQQYWQDILDFNDGIMEPCPIKDEIEHAENRINSTLEGLLFSTELNKGSTDFKYHVYPEEILHPYEVNFYFGDFYCTANNPKTHFVTIVVCKKLSPSDIFCTNNLHSLNMGNPFLKIGLTMSWYEMNKHVVTEFFYTEELSLMPNRLKRIKETVPYCDKCTLNNRDFGYYGNVVNDHDDRYKGNPESDDSDLDNPFKEYISNSSEQSNNDQNSDDLPYDDSVGAASEDCDYYDPRDDDPTPYDDDFPYDDNYYDDYR
uniref:PHYHIP_C domain-containing protein n=1 Tax=Panagrellus redivivus TaxID=6233 RepID=A0A7E4UVY5_PANRE